MLKKNLITMVFVVAGLMLISNVISFAKSVPVGELNRTQNEQKFVTDKQTSDSLFKLVEFNQNLFSEVGNFSAFNSDFSINAELSTTGDACAVYYNKGYCTDWVFQRTGHRQSGNAAQWRGNIPVNQGRAGDVGVQLIGKFGHVFVIEGLSYQPYTAILNGYIISEMNFGPRWVNEACGITNLFGVRTQRIIPISKVARIWRP